MIENTLTSYLMEIVFVLCITTLYEMCECAEVIYAHFEIVMVVIVQ